MEQDSRIDADELRTSFDLLKEWTGEETGEDGAAAEVQLVTGATRKCPAYRWHEESWGGERDVHTHVSNAAPQLGCRGAGINADPSQCRKLIPLMEAGCHE